MIVQRQWNYVVLYGSIALLIPGDKTPRSTGEITRSAGRIATRMKRNASGVGYI